MNTGIAQRARFRPAEVSNNDDLPFRPRSHLGPMAEFRSDGAEPISALIQPELLDELRRNAEAGRPNEVLGLLLGRRFADGIGRYAVICDLVQAEADDSGAVHVRVDAETISELRRTALEDKPILDPVGWWHTHPSPSGFSSVDRREQGTWQDPAAIGLIAYMTGTTRDRPVTAYCGPNAVSMRLIRSPEAERPGTVEPAGTNTLSPPPAPKAAAHGTDKHRAGRQPNRRKELASTWRPALVASMVVATALILAAFIVSHGVGEAADTVRRSRNAVPTTVAPMTNQEPIPRRTVEPTIPGSSRSTETGQQPGLGTPAPTPPLESAPEEGAG